MASVENLKNEIAEKQTEIETTQEKLAQSQAEEDEQYELMKNESSSFMRAAETTAGQHFFWREKI